MIKIKVVCVGRVKESYFSEAIAEYKKRLGRFCELKIVELKEENFVKEPNSEERERIIAKEGEYILNELSGYVITLAIEGKKHSSEELADRIKSLKDIGSGEVTFVIGGSYGVDMRVKRKSNLLLSFSDMTFPHTLARVMLLEQVYRAFTIIAGSNYHK